MTTQTDPQDRPEIRFTNDLLTAMRAGIEIATRSDIYESERRVTERLDERLNAQDRRTDARFDAQDARMDSFETRLNENTAATNENTEAIRELIAASAAERRTKDRVIQWLSIGVAGLGTLAGILGVAFALLSAAN